MDGLQNGLSVGGFPLSPFASVIEGLYPSRQSLNFRRQIPRMSIRLLR